MNNDNGFDLVIYVDFYMSPQLGGLGHKAQDLVISICFVKYKIIHNYTSAIFIPEVKFSSW